MVHKYRRSIDKTYSEWAIDCVLNWKNKNAPSNLIHIHGDKDRIFRIRNLKPHYIIKTGGHFMVMNRASELNKLLIDIINNT